MVAEQARAEVGPVVGILVPPHRPPASLLPALEPTSPLAAHWLAPPARAILDAQKVPLHCISGCPVLGSCPDLHSRESVLIS